MKVYQKQLFSFLVIFQFIIIFNIVGIQCRAVNSTDDGKVVDYSDEISTIKKQIKAIQALRNYIISRANEIKECITSKLNKLKTEHDEFTILNVLIDKFRVSIDENAGTKTSENVVYDETTSAKALNDNQLSLESLSASQLEEMANFKSLEAQLNADPTDSTAAFKNKIRTLQVLNNSIILKTEELKRLIAKRINTLTTQHSEFTALDVKLKHIDDKSEDHLAELNKLKAELDGNANMKDFDLESKEA